MRTFWPELVVVIVVGFAVLSVRLLAHFGRRVVSTSARRMTNDYVDSERQRARLMALCTVIAILSIPLILKLVPPNGSYGFRTGLTRSSPAIWYAANAFMGWALVVAAVISATLLATLPRTVKRWLLWVTFFLPLAGAIVASFAYLKRLA